MKLVALLKKFNLSNQLLGAAALSLTTFVTTTPSKLSAQTLDACGCEYTIPVQTYNGTGSPVFEIRRSDIPNAAIRKICFAQGTFTKKIRFIDFNGSTDGGVNKPYTFTNCSSGVTTIQGATDNYACIEFQNCKYFKLTGSGNATKYGIVLDGGLNTLHINTTSTDAEIERIEVKNSGFAGVMAKWDNPPSRTSHLMKNMKFHDNYVHHTTGEGFYIGNTSWSLTGT